MAACDETRCRDGEKVDLQMKFPTSPLTPTSSNEQLTPLAPTPVSTTTPYNRHAGDLGPSSARTPTSPSPHDNASSPLNAHAGYETHQEQLAANRAYRDSIVYPKTKEEQMARFNAAMENLTIADSRERERRHDARESHHAHLQQQQQLQAALKDNESHTEIVKVYGIEGGSSVTEQDLVKALGLVPGDYVYVKWINNTTAMVKMQSVALAHRLLQTKPEGLHMCVWVPESPVDRPSPQSTTSSSSSQRRATVNVTAFSRMVRRTANYNDVVSRGPPRTPS
ncbi:hypothetical protein DIPPA_35753 [Diplonema papillatum]|nr:hypothetical protein DIPPA_35753 [Diplonema papillatum]